MVTELQFIAVAVFLMWGLAASLCGLLKTDIDDEGDQATAVFASGQIDKASASPSADPSPEAHAA